MRPSATGGAALWYRTAARRQSARDVVTFSYHCNYMQRASGQAIGVRELKARLSEHLRRVRAGERLVITDRGEAIATLGPIAETAKPAWLLQLVAEGKVSWGGVRTAIGSRPRVKIARGAAVSHAVIEDRR